MALRPSDLNERADLPCHSTADGQSKKIKAPGEVADFCCLVRFPRKTKTKPNCVLL